MRARVGNISGPLFKACFFPHHYNYDALSYIARINFLGKWYLNKVILQRFQNESLWDLTCVLAISPPPHPLFYFFIFYLFILFHLFIIIIVIIIFFFWGGGGMLVDDFEVSSSTALLLRLFCLGF